MKPRIYILAIDFDNTIVYSKYPNIIGLKPNVVEVMQRLHKEGFIIIVNSCRNCPHDSEAYHYLISKGVYFDYFNENSQIMTGQYGETRKISADIMIDDKNLGGIPDDWEEIYTLIHKDIEKIENEE